MALRAFREEYVASSEIEIENFIDPEARKIRYDILWAQYENTVYRSIHAWAGTYKTRYALYRYIRNIYNPAYRLGEFWKAHTWGGPLDPEAGEEGALPIETTNKNIRPPIADIWQWSNWATRKDIVTLQGAIYGDSHNGMIRWLRELGEIEQLRAQAEIIADRQAMLRSLSDMRSLYGANRHSGAHAGD